MSSFYRSDVSHSTRDSRDSTSSAISGRGNPAGAKRVTQLTAVTGNRAYDNTLQINGPVADQVSSYVIKYAFFSCHCNGAKAVASMAPAHPRLAGSVGHRSPNIVRREEIPSLLKAKWKVTIVSKRTEKPDTIYVISSRGVHDNFISRNVIRRFGFGTRFDAETVSSIIWDSKRHTSNGDFVDLSFPLPGSSESVTQRLVVLDKPPFDMLLGGSAGSISFVQKQKALLY